MQVSIRTVLVLLAVAASLVAAQSYQKGMSKSQYQFQRYAGGASRNKFRVDVYPFSNSSRLFAGQEARLRVSTTLFNLEKYRVSTTSLETFAHFPLWAWAAGARLLNLTAFNITGPSAVRVRIVPAFPSRASSGIEVPCFKQTDVWQESWGMSARSTAWGRELAFSGYVTFTAPPFPWKACFKDTTDKNSTRKGMTRGMDTESTNWLEFDHTIGVQYVRDPLYVWQGASSMQVGDFAAIRVGSTANPDYSLYNLRHFNPTEFTIGTGGLIGDQMKFVPAGFPCTYEKMSASSDAVHNVGSKIDADTNAKQYCGSNAIAATSARFLTSTCVAEGSIAEGVFKTGTNTQNPFATFTTLTNARVTNSETLVGYTRLPAAGDYDICFSPAAYRKAIINVTIAPVNVKLVNPVPVWFKLYKDSSCLPTVGTILTNPLPSCASRMTMLTTVAATNAITWMAIDTTPGSWGTIKISGTGLNSGLATKWEYSATREYYTTVGGDNFRIVPDSAFTAAAGTVFYGDVYKRADGTRLTINLQVKESAAAAPTSSGVWDIRSRIRVTATAGGAALTTVGENRFDQYFLGQPDRGTFLTTSGCWYHANDNFGDGTKALFGAPGSQCCSVGSNSYCSGSTCSMTDRFDDGPSASGDLGGNPRSGYSAWALSASSQTDVWAYVRFPKAGNFRVCYRQVGTNNWRQIPIGAVPVGANLKAGAFSFMPIADYTQMNFTYHMNDTSAGTWGELVVTSRLAELNTMPLNYYDSSVADANVVGSALKIVEYTQSCYVDAGRTAAFSTNPGNKECSVGQCGASETCANCRGSSEDDATLRHRVSFYVRVPAAGGQYRVCFKKGVNNWNILPDPKYVRTLTTLNMWLLSPMPAPAMTYELYDYREGTWGRFVFKRGNSVINPLNAVPNNNVNGDGDVFRVVVNTTSRGKEVFCDNVWGATATAGEQYVLQNFNAQQSVNDLGLYCAASSADSTSACYSDVINPTKSIAGRYPYSLFNSKDNSRNIAYDNGAVGFMTIPAQIVSGRPVGYKVCYKQFAQNWIEVQPSVNVGQLNFLTVSKRPSYVASVSHYGQVIAGSYGYIAITGSATNVITVATDLVKLVPDAAGGCDREAAGTGSKENNFISFAGVSGARGGARIVGNTDADAVLATPATTYTTARAYMVFPTVGGRSTVSTAYKVCLMTRASASTVTQNWQNLGTINVLSTGVVYTGQNKPTLGGVSTFKFLANANYALNTSARGDSAKLVDIASPCVGSSAVVPSGVASQHVGIELANANTTIKADGLVDLGPSDDPLSAIAIMRTTLPYTAGYLKVCYRLASTGVWFEVEQAPVGFLEYGLGSEGINPVASGVTSFTVNTQILAQDPADGVQTNYATGVAYTGLVLGGVSSVKVSGGTTPYFSVVMTGGYTSSTSDSWKLVQAAVETPAGVWTPVVGADCLSPSQVTGAASVASGTSQGDMYLNFPTSGKWLVCYRRANTDVWVQVPAAAAAVGNPLTIVPNRMTFVADLTALSVTVTDSWNYNNQQQGGLSNNDTVYMVNRSDVCGAVNSFNNYAVATAALPLNNSATNTVQAIRSVGMSVWWLSAANLSAYSGWFKLCVYRSQEAKVNNTGSSTGTPKPYVRSNWYQIDNVGTSATGGSSSFFVNSQPAKLVIDACPPFNMTRKLKTGSTFDITVFVADANNNKMDFSVGTYANEINVVSADTTKALPIQNTGGSCKSADAATYGWSATNLRQFTEKGKVTFTLAAIGACPSGGCQLQFSTPTTTISASRTCTFDVIPTTIARAQIVSAPSTCQLGAKCVVRLAVYTSENVLAYTAANAVTVTPANFAGIGITMNGASSLTGAAAAGNVASGFLDTQFEFAATNGALFTANTAVSLSFSVSGLNVTTTITVLRPVISAVHIVDIYADATVLKSVTSVKTETNPDFFVRSALVPSWEPTMATGYWTGGRAALDGSSVLSAANGYHLVAQQFYTVTLRAVGTAGGVSSYINAATLLDSTKSITIVTDTLTAAGNAVIGSCSDESCTNSFTAVSFTSVKQMVTFRLQNGKGCTRSKGGCVIQFQFGGANLGGVTSITTPVRSIATQLTGECWADDGVAAYDATALTSGASTCSRVASTVENGWLVRVTAKDQFGDADEYFEGNVLAVLDSGNGMTTAGGINLTTVAALSGGRGASLVSAKASLGVAVLTTVTLSRPCASGCNLQVLSDWGANLLTMGSLVATASTKKLRCSLAGTTTGVIGNYNPVAQRTISGPFTFDSTTAGNNVGTMIYEDTPICINVEAVNANNVKTLYETNWVLYFADAGGVTITDTNNNVDRRRYRPLVRSAATFCFTVSYSATTATAESTTFSLRFVAQKFNDAGYWATGTNGQCSMGTFTVFKRKNIAALRVTSATGMNTITTLPSNAVTVAAQRTSATSATALTLGFGVYDHYGRAISNSQIVETGYGVVIRSCKGTTTGGLDSTCQSGTVGSADGSPVVSTTREAAEAGVVTVTVGSATSAALGQATAATYALTFDKYCIGCQLTFDVKKGTDLLTTKLIADGSTVSAISATVSVNILIQLDSNIGRRLAFVKGTSPYRSSYWQTWAAGSTSATTGLVTFASACFDTTTTTSTSSCYAKESIGLLQATCDPRGATTISAGASNTPIQMYVVVTEAAATPLDSTVQEPICGTSGTSTTCTTSANIGMQVDVLNTYSVAVSIGTQVLTCVGSACTNDKTTSVSQTIAAAGTSVVDAITKFSGFAATSFLLQGVNPSNYYAVDSSNQVRTIPSVNGKFAATATTNASGVTVTGITSTNSFIWRGPQKPQSFVVRNTTADSACSGATTYACLSTTTDTVCPPTGYPQFATLDQHAFSYVRDTTTIPIGVSFPVTTEVLDSASRRVLTAGGTVTVALASWVGCNNGGTMTIAGSSTKQVQLDNGRVTVWVSFSAACQSCVLSFTLTPSSTQTDLYADLNNNPGALTVLSHPLTVAGIAVGRRLIVTNALSEVKQSLTVADSVSLALGAYGHVGRLQVADTTAAVVAYAYNTIIGSTTANWWWTGNGGILRSSKSASLTDHHGASSSFTGSGTLAFMFTRTCASCQVTVAYVVGTTSASFVVRNNGASSNTVFRVVTAQTQQVLVGFRPRYAQRKHAIAAAVWHMGSELASESTNPIVYAGVASTNASTVSTVTKSVDNNTNGDGGAVTVRSWTTDRAEAHQISFFATCDKCTLKVGTDSFSLNVYTVATHLRFDLNGAASAAYTQSYPMTTTYFSFTLLAADNDGFIDRWFGGYSYSCAFSMPFQCSTSPSVAMSAVLSANGRTSGGFTPTGIVGFQSADSDATKQAGTFLTTASQITDGRAVVQVSFATPVNVGIPLFTSTDDVTVSSVVPSGLSLPVPTVSIVPSNTQLVLAATAATSAVAQVPLTVTVGLVRSVDSTQAMYVVGSANNVVTATLGTGCPALVSGTSKITTQLAYGIGTLALTFADATAANTQCSITLTAGAGTGVCTTCSKVITVTVSGVSATKWVWVRPTSTDNGGTIAAGPYFGAAGRRTFFQVATRGVNPLDSTSDVAVACTGCTLTLDFTACGTNAPVSSAVTATFDTDGTATASVTWKSTPTSYTCGFTASVKTAANVVLNSPTYSSGTVSVCTPARVVMVTNVTSKFGGAVLRTGQAYTFEAKMLDASGVHCPGDSQDDSTSLTIDAVTTDLVARASDSVKAININLVDTTTSGLAAAAKATAAPATTVYDLAASIGARNTVKAVYGGFNFSVVFSNTTTVAGARPVRVRVVASSSTPTISGTSASAISGAVDTTIAATTLRFLPTTDLPRYAVSSWNFITAGTAANISFGVQAVDSLDPSWAALGLVGASPNVAARSSEAGNNLAVQWVVEPTVTGSFPISFATGAAATTLTAGQATFSGLSWTSSTEGTFSISVGPADASSTVKSTRKYLVTVQALSKILINTTNFSPSSGTYCASDCVLPNTTYTLLTDNTTNVQYLNSSSRKAANVSVFVADSNNQAVIADSNSVLMADLDINTTSATLGVPTTYTTTAPLYARVAKGVASFSIGFIGTTAVTSGSNNHTRVRVRFSCPKTRPAALLNAGESTDNPCYTRLQSVTALTRQIQIVDSSAPASAFSSSEAQAAAPRLKIVTGLPSIGQFNATEFKKALAAAMSAQMATPIFDANNADQVIQITACDVDALFGDADLGTSVCGAQGLCTTRNVNCPLYVYQCICAGTTARAMLLNRYLLDSTSVRVEASFSLAKAVGFSGTSTADIVAAYTQLASVATNVLKTNSALVSGFSIDTSRVSSVSSTSPIVTATQTPTPAPPVATPAPTNAPPPSAASTFHVLMALLVAAVLALIM